MRDITERLRCRMNYQDLDHEAIGEIVRLRDKLEKLTGTSGQAIKAWRIVYQDDSVAIYPAEIVAAKLLHETDFEPINADTIMKLYGAKEVEAINFEPIAEYGTEIHTCMGGHKFAVLADHPKNGDDYRCPHCMAETIRVQHNCLTTINSLHNNLVEPFVEVAVRSHKYELGKTLRRCFDE